MSDRIDNAQSVVSAMREMDGNAVFNGWIDTLAEALVYAEEARKGRDEWKRRAAVLENAAKRCGTCVHYPTEDRGREVQETCYRAGCRTTGPKYIGWELNVQKFLEGGAENE